jgi:predicted AlkP superfamily phosphohydrolase/phosphomutase
MATGLFLRGDPAARDAFLRLYEQLDGYIGWFLERSADLTVAVLSDHGQCEETHVVRVNSLLRRLGYVRTLGERPGGVAVDGNGRPARGTVRVPTALRRLRRVPGLQRLVRLATRGLRRTTGIDVLPPTRANEVDRVLSRAFSPTVASYAIHTRDCTSADLERIRAALLGLRLDDERAPIDGIWTFEELYGLTPPPGAPTFVYAPALGVRPSVNLVEPVTDRVQREGRGAHQQDGILLVAGPGVVPGELARCSLCDLAPTLLWAMGAPIPVGADGRVLFEAFDEDFAGEREVREAEGETAQRAPVTVQDSGEVEHRLRQLGYL